MRQQALTYGALGAILALSAGTATANSIGLDVNSISGIWTSVDPADTRGLNGVGSASINWGVPADFFGVGPQSGYDFTAATTPFTAAAGTLFNLGTFTHRNEPIRGFSSSPPSSIESATLTVDTNITIDGWSDTITSVFEFDHFETPNSGTPCAAGGSQPCPDLVTAALNEGASESVVIGGVEYFFSITGFEIEGTVLDSFLTLEEQSNSAVLKGEFTSEPITTVPIPAAAWLFGSALLGAVGLGRRNSKKKREA